MGTREEWQQNGLTKVRYLQQLICIIVWAGCARWKQHERTRLAVALRTIAKYALPLTVQRVHVKYVINICR